MKETKFKQTEVGMIPSDWEETYLGNIGPVKMCKRVMKYQTSEKGDIPFYKIGTFGKSPDAYISKDLYHYLKNKYSFPQKGTVLISAAGTIGRTVVYDGKDAFFQDSNIVWLENDESVLTNQYLYYLYQVVEWKTEMVVQYQDCIMTILRLLLSQFLLLKKNNNALQTPSPTLTP